MASAQEQQLESLNEMLVEIRKDVEDATLLAGKVSEKFTEVSKSIQDLSKTFSKAFKDEGKAALAGAAVYATGFAVKLIGKAVSAIKKEYELNKLLPKKQEIARNKREIIKNHLINLENREPKILLLLEKELEKEISLSDTEIKIKNSLSICFELYALSMHLKNVCFFLLAEFDAWDQNEHNSEISSPILHETLNQVIMDPILPDGVKSLSKINSAQAYLFKKYQSLLGTIFITAFNEGFYIESTKEKEKEISMVNKPSFIFVNKVLLDINKQYDKNNTYTNWIKSNYFYIEIKKVHRFYGTFFDIGKYIFLVYLILFLLQNFSVSLNFASIFLAVLVSFILTCIIYLFILLRDWFSGYRFSFQRRSLFEILLNIALHLASFGSLYYAEKRLAKKEYKYYALFSQLNNLNKLI